MRLPGVARTAPAATGRMSNKTGEPASCRKTTTTTRPAEGRRHHPRRHRGAGRTSTSTRPRAGAQRHAAERGASRHGNAGPIAGPAGKGGGSTAHGKQPEAAHIPTCSPRGGQTPSRRNNRQRAQLSHSPREAKRADDTVRTEPRLGAGTVQPCRYVWIDRDAAHGGHRGAGVNTDYVDPQKGKMLPAAALAAAAESYALDGPGQIPLAGSRGQPRSHTEVHKSWQHRRSEWHWPRAYRRVRLRSKIAGSIPVSDKEAYSIAGGRLRLFAHRESCGTYNRTTYFA